MELAEIKYTEHFVAFLDILGFKNFIDYKYLKPEETIKHLNDSMEYVRRTMAEEGKYTINPSIKVFSDCICVSCETQAYGNDILGMLLELIADFQLYLTISGIFIRGCLSIGRHFENDIMIFSEGLVNAYEIEKRETYPRIIIDEKCFPQIKSMPLIDRQVKLIARPHNEKMYLDYLERIIPLNRIYTWPLESFENHKEAILKEINRNIKDSHVLDKYRWLAKYHNAKALEYGRTLDMNDNRAKEHIKDITIDIENLFPKLSRPQSEK